MVVNICGGNVAWMAWVKCKNPGALPPILVWEGLLATETSDPRIIEGEDNTGDEVDAIIRWITECDRAKFSFISGLIPRFLRFFVNLARMA